MDVQLLRHAFPISGQTAALAAHAEAAGWDGLVLSDSQNLVCDPYVELALAASKTRGLLLGTAVTNLVTRDPAVTASAMLSVHAESKGRAILGVARGDSALGFLGERSMPLDAYRIALGQLRAYLDGRVVERNGFSASITWPASLDLPPLPLDVHATGPRVITLAAVVADRLTFAVCAQPAWMSWAIETARTAREKAGFDPADLRLGAFLMSAVASDPVEAAHLVRGNVSIFAHVAGEGRAIPGAVPERQRAVIDQVVASYAESEHGSNASTAASELPSAFVEWFAACGTIDQVVDRLSGLVELGLDHLVVVGAARDADPHAAEEAALRFDSEVLPALRTA
jgi:5,10-methylenetetrahydromethanopterin reductase